MRRQWVVIILACSGTELVAASSSSRIDLAESGRVVEMLENPTSGDAEELIRGAEGWEAVLGDDGQYTIGLEWDEPRELTEVNIEFRHAIANREQIRVQYWRPDASPPAQGNPAPGTRVRGRWLTPKVEWWAGDRDVSFAFQPGDQETPGRPDARTRRTTRLRFLCGDQDMPPVRYLRAYGPAPSTTDTFEFRFEPKGTLAPPVLVEALDGSIMAADGKTKMGSAVLREPSGSLQIRYALTQADSPNKTQLILSPVSQPHRQTIVLPVEVARAGGINLEKSGVMVERRGGKLQEIPRAAASNPAEAR